ncbi:ribbon-helix-helix protein, CopG family [Hyphomonas sp. CY54-11-8]|uniref:ribbon-helix-helix protein, CopG family n=1 Tax=Hyphomonas sp. CY54-11-8 TaxID=1280944 RepID=UPI000458ACAA|nr:ribbon-helix-helix protein, CopG family [Hyphomonas sp. CY54-11-8]KCZ48481.1 hypothetical protein HY17_16660 [Hyphomonas sp. CY54-11-8]
MRKQRLHIRLTPQTLARLEAAAASPGVTKSALAEEAIRLYFDPERADSQEAVLLRRLNAFDLRQDAIERDVALTLETLGQFVLYWLTRTDPLPEGERNRAHNLGQRRFDYFIEQVATKLSGDNSLSARLFPETTHVEQSDRKGE